MESITVYQKVPHPGIQVNLNSYYAKQVRGASRESSAGRAPEWRGPGDKRPKPLCRALFPAVRLAEVPSLDL